MDDGNGRFQTFRTIEELGDKLDELRVPEPSMTDLAARVVPSESEIASRIFQVGEEVRIKGSRFRVTEIEGSGRMVLQLLPR